MMSATPRIVYQTTFNRSQYPDYALYHQFCLERFVSRADRSQRLLLHKHTCGYCSKLDCFSEHFNVNCQKSWLGVPDPRFAFRKANINCISDPYDLHVFTLCCLAFGVGDWERFCRVPPLQKYTNDQLEFTTHVQLAVWDILPFAGLQVWAPYVRSELHKLVKDQREADPDYPWPIKGDLVRNWFVDPLQYEQQTPLSRSAALFAFRKQLGANQESVHNALNALGMPPTFRVSWYAADAVNHSRCPTVQYHQMGFQGRLPVVDAKQQYEAMLAQAQNVVQWNLFPKQADVSVMEIEQQVLACGGDMDKILDLFRARKLKQPAQIISGGVTAHLRTGTQSTIKFDKLKAVNNERSQQSEGVEKKHDPDQLNPESELTNPAPSLNTSNISSPSVKNGQAIGESPHDALVDFSKSAQLRMISMLAMNLGQVQEKIDQVRDAAQDMTVRFQYDMQTFSTLAQNAHAMANQK